MFTKVAIWDIQMSRNILMLLILSLTSTEMCFARQCVSVKTTAFNTNHFVFIVSRFTSRWSSGTVFQCTVVFVCLTVSTILFVLFLMYPEPPIASLCFLVGQEALPRYPSVSKCVLGLRLSMTHVVLVSVHLFCMWFPRNTPCYVCIRHGVSVSVFCVCACPLVLSRHSVFWSIVY